MTTPQPWFGSQNCLRASQAQSGRSKKPSSAQRANSPCKVSTQAKGFTAGISVMRSVDFGVDDAAGGVALGVVLDAAAEAAIDASFGASFCALFDVLVDAVFDALFGEPFGALFNAPFAAPFCASLDDGSSCGTDGTSAGIPSEDGARCKFGAGTGVDPAVSQSLGEPSAGCSGKRVSGTRPELAGVASGPVMPLFGAFHDTTSSTSAA